MCIGIGMILDNELKLYVSKVSDSHEDIITEFGLDDKHFGNDKKIVRLEILPKGDFMSKNIKDWEVVIEDEEKPSWFKWELIKELNVVQKAITLIHNGRYLDFKGYIDLSGCTGLTSIPKLKAGGSIELSGCTGLTSSKKELNKAYNNLIW